MSNAVIIFLAIVAICGIAFPVGMLAWFIYSAKQEAKEYNAEHDLP